MRELGDLTSAVYSKQGALDVNLKLFGEEHPGVAESYFELAIIEKAHVEDASAHQSVQLPRVVIQKLSEDE